MLKEKTITITTLRTNLSSIIKEVERGVFFIVTRYGAPVFRIVPYVKK